MQRVRIVTFIRTCWLRLRQAFSAELNAMPVYRAIAFTGPAPLLHRPWPERPFTPDRQLGEEMLGGSFSFAGKTLTFDTIEQAWTRAAPSKAHARKMHEFSWLRDLDDGAADTKTAKLAKAHIDTWIRHYGNWNRFAWDPAITAERCVSWLGAANLLFFGDAVQVARRLESLSRQLRYLQSCRSVMTPGGDRLLVALVLCQAGTCLRGLENLKKSGFRHLEEELARQILSDGGHISRNPQTASRIYLELETLIALVEQHDGAAPAFLRKTLDRLTPFISFISLPNGELAPFNGGGEGDVLAIRQSLRHLDGLPKQFVVAPHSAYQRVHTPESVLLFDGGGSPDGFHSVQAHAGANSFVFAASSPLVINCGSATSLSPPWTKAARTSAAHSTLIIDDMSSSKIADRGWLAKLYGPQMCLREEPIGIKRTEEEDGAWLEGRHLEYVSRYGLAHSRKLFLDKAGIDLRGEDVLERPVRVEKTTDLEPVPFAIRFHLHPDVRVNLSRGKSSAMLVLPDGNGWAFRSDQVSLELQPSVYLAKGAPPRRTCQIIILGAADPNGTGQEPNNRVRWSLRRM